MTPSGARNACSDVRTRVSVRTALHRHDIVCLVQFGTREKLLVARCFDLRPVRLK